MLRLDAHQHFWRYDENRDSWITPEMSVIRRDFMPEDLHPLLIETGFDGCIAVQASQTEAETHFLLELASRYLYIRSVVGWIDLKSAALEERLSYYKSFEKLSGFRHILQGEPVRDLMLQPQFKQGIELLGKHGYRYDILINNDQLGYTYQLCRQLDDQLFIIDHLAKPDIRGKAFESWQNEIQQFQELEHVYCKVSGMVTEAHWHHWKESDFTPYLDTILEVFGARRLVFGSDWPVCLLAAGYSEVVKLVEEYFKKLSVDERAGIFGGNAQYFYGIKN